MASQIQFFRKNWADYERSSVVVTASEDSGSTAQCMLDRSNRTAWGTTGSVDANNTTFTVDMSDVGTLDSLFLIGHNFKNFLIEYYDANSSSWKTLENITNCTDSTSFYSFATISSSKIRVTIYGTQVADSDKILQQFIATTLMGKFNGWPVLKSPRLSRNLQEQKMLSGKSYISQNVGFYGVQIQITVTSDTNDLSIIESMQNSNEGFLFWPCGGDQTQFSSVRQGWSLQDIFLVRCKNEFTPEWYQGLYKSGQVVALDLVEVIT